LERGEPLRVVVLGAGTVGTEVIRRLVDRPERYEIEAILVRSLDKARASFVPIERLISDPLAVKFPGADIVVDALNGVEPALQILEAAQSAGAAIVTANKELRVAMGGGVGAVGDAATVGGGAPFLESVRRVASTLGVRSLRGILNGTCNAILDDIGKGATVEAAIARARACGFAEEDLSADLSGEDVVRKLTLLAGACGVDSEAIEWECVEGIAPEDLRALGESGVRQVGTLRFDAEGSPRARVRLERLAPEDSLSGLAGEWNRLEIESPTGQAEVVSGRGAGGVPTATAVFADIEDACRSLTALVDNVVPAKSTVPSHNTRPAYDRVPPERSSSRIEVSP